MPPTGPRARLCDGQPGTVAGLGRLAGLGLGQDLRLAEAGQLVAAGDGVGVDSCEEGDGVGARLEAAPRPQPPTTTATRMATKPTAFTGTTSASCDTRRLASALLRQLLRQRSCCRAGGRQSEEPDLGPA
jgi:hypothetical protein